MDDIRFKIAEAARLAGVSASTLRLWQAQGLIEPILTASGQRLYDQALIDRLKTIAWLRSEKGLNPAAIRESLQDQGVLEEGDDFSAAGEGEETTDLPIGAKIRRIRRESGQTLESVSKATGVTTSMLSTFERTSQGLSFTSLHRVASHFGTTIAALSGQEERGEGQSLIRDGKWATWPSTSSGVTIQVLAEGRTQMECHRFQLAPGASSEGAYQHVGEEFIHVLSGSLEIVLDGDQFHTLNAGDSFYFESCRPHSWRNSHEGETILLWVNTPPTF